MSCAVYNLAVILPIQWCRLRGQGVYPSTIHNIKEWTGAIYTSQVYNHGFHVVREMQGCNLEPALFRGLSHISSYKTGNGQRCLYDEILLGPYLAIK